MLPPVLEIYPVWHPDDHEGGFDVAERFVEHFHGTLFSGLIGGAVEIYVRSEGWIQKGGPPRPIPLPGDPPPNGVAPAEIIAVVPILGVGLAGAVEDPTSAWHAYLSTIAAARHARPDRVGLFPTLLEGNNIFNTTLSRLVGDRQMIAAPSIHAPPEPMNELRCRDLAQAIAQLVEGRGDSHRPLTIFISHTKRYGVDEEAQVAELIDCVRTIVRNTRLNEFFDAHDLQPGHDWDKELRAKAGTSALLCLRTDLYATREWCQREVRIAKQEGMPVVILDALGNGEERGCFLMDHVPRVPVRRNADGWQEADVRRGLNLLVDECLKQALWHRQKDLATEYPNLSVAWWAAHAPEPTTLAAWIESEKAAGRLGDLSPIRVLHPDPPLGADERLVLEQIASLSGLGGRIEIMTPRMLAARGG